MNGVVEKSTGDLLRAGFCDFRADGTFDAAAHDYRTDVPEPAQCRGDSDWKDKHRWDGSKWILVPQ